MKTDNNVAEIMSSLLDSSIMKKTAQDVSIKTAISNLDKAAEILDDLGNYVASEAITEVIESIPKSIKETK